MMSDQIKRIDINEYQVNSQSGNGVYDVLSTESGWICSCPDHVYRGVKCKHVFAVEFSIALRKKVEERVVISPINVLACPKCKSERIVRNAVRHNKSGDIQRYMCKACEKRFSFNIGFEKMRATPQAITGAMQLYFTGESLRNVQKFLRLQGISVDHTTVYRWIKKYVGLMEKYLEQIKPQVSDTWRADELYVKIKGDMKYLFALMDDATRFLIAQEVADTKHEHDASSLFRRGKKVTGKKPETLITDRLASYHLAYMKEFRTLKSPVTKHVNEISFDGERHNNKMERLNGEIRDREKVMRGLKKKDTPILIGYQIFHNYVREHEGLNGRTPAEMCGIKVKGRNKWLTLIQNASKGR
jgi:transposase-like protein